MTVEPDTEPWMPNGFPPPSFVVTKHRVGTVVTSRNRWILAAALVGVVLLVAGLLQLAQGGSDRTALKTGASTTVPDTTDLATPDTFPPDPTLTPAPEANQPPPTLPVLPPGTSPVAPGTTAKKVTTTVPRPAPTPRPTRAQTPLPPPAPPPPPAPAPAPAPNPITSTTSPPPMPPNVSPVGATYAQSTPCDGDWDVKAKVEDADGVQGVSVILSGPGSASASAGRSGEIVMAQDQQGNWTATLSQANATVSVEILARDRTSASTRTNVETYPC